MAKVTLSIAGEVLTKVRERAVRRRGKLRALSEEVEDVLRDSLAAEEALAEEGEAAPIGFGDVRPLRLAPGPPLTRMVRDDREHRDEPPARRKRRA